MQDVDLDFKEVQEQIIENTSENSETRIEDDILGLKKHWLDVDEKNYSYSSTHFWVSHLEDGMRKLLYDKLSLYDMKSANVFFTEKLGFF